MVSPPWLANLELELSCVEETTARVRFKGTVHNIHITPPGLRLAILSAYAPAAHHWLDTHLVHGNPDHTALATRLTDAWQSFRVVWVWLPEELKGTPVASLGIRLTGLGFIKIPKPPGTPLPNE